MKLTKVVRVLKLFDITDTSDYRIEKYDPNRIPNSHITENGSVKKCKVSLMLDSGDIEWLPFGERTRIRAQSENVLAVFVEFHHMDKTETKTIKYQKSIYIK